jgi:DNA-directed RNA polymerase I, II, and III subunit RPABC1
MRELWLARNTIIEMLSERGYSSSNTPLNYASFIAQFPTAGSTPSSLNFIASKTDSLAVHFSNEEKLSKKSLETLTNEYSSQGISKIIVITGSKLNPACNALLKNIKLQIEHFLIEELQFNITKHHLVPKHRIMDKEEQKGLLGKLRCEVSNLPSILTNDPVSRFYGANIGDVFEITRNSQTAGTAFYYRVVREPGLKDQ